MNYYLNGKDEFNSLERKIAELEARIRDKDEQLAKVNALLIIYEKRLEALSGVNR